MFLCLFDYQLVRMHQHYSHSFQLEVVELEELVFNQIQVYHRLTALEDYQSVVLFEHHLQLH